MHCYMIGKLKLIDVLSLCDFISLIVPSFLLVVRKQEVHGPGPYKWSLEPVLKEGSMALG